MKWAGAWGVHSYTCTYHVKQLDSQKSGAWCPAWAVFHSYTTAQPSIIVFLHFFIMFHLCFLPSHISWKEHRGGERKKKRRSARHVLAEGSRGALPCAHESSSRAYKRLGRNVVAVWRLLPATIYTTSLNQRGPYFDVFFPLFLMQWLTLENVEDLSLPFVNYWEIRMPKIYTVYRQMP